MQALTESTTAEFYTLEAPGVELGGRGRGQRGYLGKGHSGAGTHNGAVLILAWIPRLLSHFLTKKQSTLAMFAKLRATCLILLLPLQ